MIISSLLELAAVAFVIWGFANTITPSDEEYRDIPEDDLPF